MVKLAKVCGWSSRGLADASEVMLKVARSYAEVRDELERLFSEEMLGAFAAAEARERRALIDDADDLYRAHERAGHEFADAAEAVDRVVREAERIVELVTSEGLLLSDDGAIIPNPHRDESLPAPRINIGEVSVQGAHCAAWADGVVEDVRATYAGLESMVVAGRGQAPAIISHGVVAPRGEWTPQEVNDWWTALSPREQEWIVVNNPDWVGNLAGIPVPVRDRANRKRIKGLIADAQYESNAYFDNAQWDVPEWNFVPALEAKRYNDKAHELENLLDKFGGEPDGVHWLMSVDSTSGNRLWVTIGIGDVDSADHVMVHALGMNSEAGDSIIGTEPDKWGGTTREVNNVLDSAGYQLSRQHRHESVAAVVSLAYDAPTIVEGVTPNSPITNAPAAGYGRELAETIEGIQATHEGDPHLVGSGHSYGSLGMSYAARNTQMLDDAVFFGSPRLRETSVDGHNVLPGHMAVAAADGDKVPWAGVIAGGDPADGLDFVRFSTHEWVGPDGKVYDESHGHSEYMKRGSTSAYNLGSILIGNGVAVESGHEK